MSATALVAGLIILVVGALIGEVAVSAFNVSRPVWRPRIVCLCGSTRFGETFREANLTETLAGRIVLSIGCDTKSDADLRVAFERLGGVDAMKRRLDQLHLRKIDLADEVLILNVGGYIGESTRRELDYARAHGKRVRFLEREG